MIVELSQKDLINLVKGVTPDYSVFGNELVNAHGTFRENYGKWEWNDASLSHLEEADLWELYQICKDSWY